MKKINLQSNLFFLELAVLFLLTISCNQDETQTVITKSKLVWEDNFDVDGVPNPLNWSFDLGGGAQNEGWGNNELQYYTNRLENSIVQNGYLIITAKQELFEGAGYTSARIKTQNLFEKKYGRIEARIKLPQGKGVWPAFWMLGSNYDQVSWPQCGEIDIIEYLGNQPTQVFGTLHGPGFFGNNSISKKFNLSNDRFDTDFHVFGIEWSENQVSWYVDNILYNQITRKKVEQAGGEWVFNQSFFMILNLAIGGNLPGSPNAETQFPQRMLVDYVRVYE